MFPQSGNIFDNMHSLTMSKDFKNSPEQNVENEQQEMNPTLGYHYHLHEFTDLVPSSRFRTKMSRCDCHYGFEKQQTAFTVCLWPC